MGQSPSLGVMGHVDEPKKRKKIRISWKNEKVVKTFLETCIQEVEDNGPRGGSICAFSWRKVAEKLKNKHNFIVDQKQMKNHYDYLKAKYKAWSTLKNKLGDLYDPLTNTFDLTEDEWDIEIKGNKYVESLKTASLVFPKLCARLYDGVVDTEDENGGSVSERSKSSAEPLLIDYSQDVNETHEASTSKQKCSSHTETQTPQGEHFISSVEPGMDEIGESNKRRKIRICWKNEKVVKTFLEACIQEVEEHEPRGGMVHSFMWSIISEKLKTSHNFIVDQKQLKNHYDYLKAKYKAWSTLKNKHGDLYNPLTNTFGLTENEWGIVTKENKYIESLKSTSLLFPELCAKLYDGVLDTEDETLGSFSERSKSSAELLMIEDAQDINETQEASTSKQNSSSHTETQTPHGERFVSSMEREAENGGSLSERSESSAEPLLIEDAQVIIDAQEASTSKHDCSPHTETQKPQGEFISTVEQGKEQTGESKKQRKIRIHWRNERVVKTFLEACIQEVEENGPRGGSILASSWSKISEKLKDRHHFIVNKKQMRNHYEYLKSKHKAWSTLKNKVGNLYDPLTNTFDLSEDEWNIQMKGNKFIESLKSAPLVFPKLCATLFDGVLDTEDESGRSFSVRPRFRAQPILLIEDTEHINETQEASTPKQKKSSHTETQRQEKSSHTETQRQEDEVFISSAERGKEQIGESNKRRKIRINWKNERVVKTFLEACIREVEENGPRGGSILASSWNKVAVKLKDSHNFIVNQKQMKNHFDYLKSKYKAWSTLKNKVGNLYDPVTNTFDLTDEEWDIELKGNKYVESLKTASLVFPKLCTQLYGRLLDTEDENGGSFSERSKSCAEPILIEDTENINETQEASTSKHNGSSHTETQTPAKQGNVSKKSTISSMEEDMSNALKLVINRNNGPSFKDCREKLQEIGWGAKNPLHKMALVIFCESATYREAWMDLQADEVEDWVRMIGHKLGLAP